MNHSLSVLFAAISAVLHLTSSYGEDCLQIMVGDTTDYNATLGDNLEINCTYQYINCTKPPYNVSWYKYERNDFVPVIRDAHTNVIVKKLSTVATKFLLRFTNIQKSNAGLYRCQSGLTLGQSIKVSVDDNISYRNETAIMEEGQWMYVYSAAGTMAFVVIVIFISVISMQRCKGRARRETQTESEHFSLVNRQAGAKPLDTQTSSNSCIYSKMSLEEERHPEKEGSSVMYAALNHQLLLGAPARPRRPKDESSEYADIRV
ncbi:B- and T-lymphocyte attenuator [Festucalex cinctus]